MMKQDAARPDRAELLGRQLAHLQQRRIAELVIQVLGKEADAIVLVKKPKDHEALLDAFQRYLGEGFWRVVMLGLVRSLSPEALPSFWTVIDTGKLPEGWLELKAGPRTDLGVALTLREHGIRRCNRAMPERCEGAAVRSANHVLGALAIELSEQVKESA